MHLNSKHSDIKHSERFIKLVKFQSSITEKYILFELKERQVDIVQLRIKYIVKAYENYFKGN
jgi:UV DNA damage repair endonuclease